jgi:acetyl/propionyl-CoA carboxylase alpha subunit
LKLMQFRNTCISKSSVFASTECFRFGDMLFTQCSQNGAQITPAPLKNSHLARPHAGHFFGSSRIAVNAAKAQVASAQASIASLQAHLIQQETAIRQAQAAVAADDAALKLARVNQARYRNLATDGSGTVQAQQQVEAQLSIQLARGEKSQAGLQAARQQVDILKADLEKARAALAHAQAAQSTAELKLSYTRITAPIGGTIGQKSVRIGAFVNAGKPLLAIVPLDAVYVTANFRETQLARVQTGQAVDIEVDALPGETLQGTVDSDRPAESATPPLHHTTPLATSPKSSSACRCAFASIPISPRRRSCESACP